MPCIKYIIGLLGLSIGSTIALCNPPSLNRDPAILHSIVGGGSPAPRVDTGSVIELNDGTLMMAYQKSDDDGAINDHAVMRVWSRISSDGGKTWIKPRLLVDILPEDLTVGMPAMQRLPSGDILLICLVHHSVSSTTMLQLRSCDDGQTFVKEPSIWERSKGIQLQGGANSIVLLESGRLVLPLMFGLPDRDTQKLATGFYLSDDLGLTWRLSPAKIHLPRRGAMEPSVAELEGGHLVVSLRTQIGGPYLSHSFDSGETWTQAEPAGWDPVIKGPVLESGESCTLLRRLPGTQTLLMVWNNSKYVGDVPGYRGHFGARSPLTAAVSSDAGKTWVVVGDIATDPDFLFTNLAGSFLSDGRAIITYYSYNRTNPWPGPPNPTQTALHVAIIDPSWFKTAIAQSVKKSNVPHPEYRPPGT